MRLTNTLCIFHTYVPQAHWDSFILPNDNTFFAPPKWWCAFENDTLRESSQPPCPLLFRFLLFGFALGWNKKLWFFVCGFGCTTHQAYKKETTLRKSNVYYKQLHKFSVRWVNSYLSIDPSLSLSVFLLTGCIQKGTIWTCCFRWDFLVTFCCGEKVLISS